jgi:hypothetical protein
MRAEPILGALFFCTGLAVGCAQSRFHCNQDGDCIDGAQQGMCQSNGHCSFPDESCPSGQRYARHSGPLSGECVDPDDASTSGPTSGEPPGDGSATHASTTSNDDASTDDGATSTVDDDTSVPPGCGDGIVDGDEECDGRNLGGADCASVGFFDGVLACSSGCTFDTSDCHHCGDGRIQADEECDPAARIDGTCQDLGWFAGTITCDEDCRLDHSACTNCGNGIVDPGELCDGEDQSDLPTCVDAGYTGDASLGCTDDCQLSTEGCGVLACGVDLDAPLTACPTTCDSCEGGVCLIACIQSSACAGEDIECPPGWPCHVDCDGSSACQNASISCPPFHACEVSCTSSSACQDASVHCSTNGGCSIECDGPSACHDTDVDCGADTCAATCAGISQPTLACGPSCDCSPC